MSAYLGRIFDIFLLWKTEYLIFISWSWEAEYLIFSFMEDRISHIFCSWKAEYLIFSFYKNMKYPASHDQDISYFLLSKTDYLIFPVHGRQNIWYFPFMEDRISHISWSWEAGWPSGCPKVAGVPIAGQEEYGEGGPSGKNCFFAKFHVI